MGSEIHEVEGEIFRRLLRLGKHLLEVFLSAVGDGKQGPTIQIPDGSIMRYQRKKNRQYLSILGELSISRAYYLGDDGNGLFLDTRPCQFSSVTIWSRKKN
jgi:hypothetical protein